MRVRGVALPVLVTTREVAAGEQLLRDYGPDWWVGLQGCWAPLEELGLSVPQIFGAAGAGEVRQP